MRQHIASAHSTDHAGNPAGGTTTGVGINIDWQNGPLGRGADQKEPNGAFVEGVIAAALDRLQFFQTSKFASPLNAGVISCLESALRLLDARTTEREARGVEGTHEK